MPTYLKAAIGKCLVTGISGTSSKTKRRWLLGYSINLSLTDEVDAPTKGRNGLSQRCWGKEDGSWLLYGWMSPSRSRFLGFTITLPGEANATATDYLRKQLTRYSQST